MWEGRLLWIGCLVLLILWRISDASAIDRYEIQIYSTETVPFHKLTLELHSNTVLNASGNLAKEELCPHEVHETLEATYGLWSHVGPVWFRKDLIALFDLLQERKIKPLIAQRFPLAEARHAHELLGKGGVIGKIVLVSNELFGSSFLTDVIKIDQNFGCSPS